MCSINPNRHSENVDTWSHITSNLLNIWIQDKNINVSLCGYFKYRFYQFYFILKIIKKKKDTDY